MAVNFFPGQKSEVGRKALDIVWPSSAVKAWKDGDGHKEAKNN